MTADPGSEAVAVLVNTAACKGFEVCAVTEVHPAGVAIAPLAVLDVVTYSNSVSPAATVAGVVTDTVVPDGTDACAAAR